MAKTKTRRWDAADYLKSDKDMAAYLEAALEENDPTLFTAALGDVARAKGMSEIARKTGLGAREPLQGALSRRQSRVRHRAQGDALTRHQFACRDSIDRLTSLLAARSSLLATPCQAPVFSRAFILQSFSWFWPRTVLTSHSLK